jgi:hypothetical protein
MNWTRPTFEELKMDAEIGSYQEDSDPLDHAPTASRPPLEIVLSKRGEAPLAA